MTAEARAHKTIAWLERARADLDAAILDTVAAGSLDREGDRARAGVLPRYLRLPAMQCRPLNEPDRTTVRP